MAKYNENDKVGVEESHAARRIDPSSLASTPHDNATCPIRTVPPPALRPDWETLA
jgi:hypothetical protein